MYLETQPTIDHLSVKDSFMRTVEQFDLDDEVVEFFFNEVGVEMPCRRIEVELSAKIMVTVIAGRNGVPRDVKPEDLVAQFEAAIENADDDFETVLVRNIDLLEDDVEWV